MKGFALLFVSAFCLSVSQAAPSCPSQAIMDCSQPMMEAISTMDFQNPDMQAMCSLYERYFSCMEPYRDSMNSCPPELSSAYNGAKSQYEMGMSSMCSVNQGSNDQGPTNGVVDDTNFTAPINESVIPEVQEAPCSEFLKCFDTNAAEALIPAGSFETGFNFPSSYVTDYCRYSADATSCMSDPEIVNNPGCSSLMRYTRLQTDSHDLFCDQQGQRDMEVIRQCANNVEVQREVFYYTLRAQGRVEGLYSCSNGTDHTAVVCNEIERGIESLLYMVDDKCGTPAKTALVRFMKEIIPSLERDVPEVSQYCPTIADFIKAL